MSLERLAPALFVLLWSTGWVAAKYGDIYSDPLTFLSVRYATAAVLFALLCRFSGVRWPKDRATILHAVVSGAFLHGFYLAAVWWAVGQGVPAALSGIIAALQPLMTAMAAITPPRINSPIRSFLILTLPSRPSTLTSSEVRRLPSRSAEEKGRRHSAASPSFPTPGPALTDR